MSTSRETLCVYVYIYIYIYTVSRGKCARIWENDPRVKIHGYNQKHLYPKLKGYGDNGKKSLKV